MRAWGKIAQRAPPQALTTRNIGARERFVLARHRCRAPVRQLRLNRGLRPLRGLTLGYDVSGPSALKISLPEVAGNEPMWRQSCPSEASVSEIRSIRAVRFFEFRPLREAVMSLGSRPVAGRRSRIKG